MRPNSTVVSLVTVSVLLLLLMPEVSHDEQVVESEPPVQRTMIPPGPEQTCPKGKLGGDQILP